MKTILVETIKDRDHKRHGQVTPGRVAEGHKAEIVPGKSIVLFGEQEKVDYTKGENGQFIRVATKVPYRHEFKIGDLAEFDSYNLSYLGKILAISEKNITIQGHGSRVRRLSLHEFDWRNYDLDLEETRKRNHETSMHI